MGSLAPELETVHWEIYLSLGLKTSGRRKSEFPRILSLLSSLLERVVQKNEMLLDSNKIKNAVTVFHGLRAPNISIQKYLERIFKYSKCSPSCFVLAHIYIDRFLHQPDIHLTSLNVHRLLITSIVVAAKFIDDAFFNNAYYAKVGGVSTVEMNRLELNFLFNLDFRLQVNLETFGSYCLQLKKQATECSVERPIQVCRLKDWTTKEDSKCQPAVPRYNCGAV
ncbi:cyclin-P3-1 [Elaeis guineensis]|uniref:Cyclin-P3-1 n=1 Tax=Elaeis guineensis var. tenera TaxID=51953 RepID=A0A6J0PAM2_ELAGV|nr:cyclin-P3-1 [Elaeis guineensis]XP_019701314.1 cyclin-P3-1 [Elaeis guineensis]XP_019701316.1 cyclin-P3-1 [Elaeis guineensis]